VVGPTGERLAKRDGAVTLADLAADGWRAVDVVAVLARSLGLATKDEPARSITTELLIDRFDPGRLTRHPVAYADLVAPRTPT
jgi:glutamyl-tRNA synthetase